MPPRRRVLASAVRTVTIVTEITLVTQPLPVVLYQLHCWHSALIATSADYRSTEGSAHPLSWYGVLRLAQYLVLNRPLLYYYSYRPAPFVLALADVLPSRHSLSHLNGPMAAHPLSSASDRRSHAYSCSHGVASPHLAPVAVPNNVCVR